MATKKAAKKAAPVPADPRKPVTLSKSELARIAKMTPAELAEHAGKAEAWDQRIEIPPNPEEAAAAGKFKPRKRTTGLALQLLREPGTGFNVLYRDVVTSENKNGSMRVSGLALLDREQYPEGRSFSITVPKKFVRVPGEIDRLIKEAIGET